MGDDDSRKRLAEEVMKLFLSGRIRMPTETWRSAGRTTVGVDLGGDDRTAYAVLVAGRNSTPTRGASTVRAWGRDWFNGGHPLDAPNATYSNMPSDPLTVEAINQAYEQVRRMADGETRVHGGSQRAGKTRAAEEELRRAAKTERLGERIREWNDRHGISVVPVSRFDRGVGENGKAVIDPPCALCGGQGVDVSSMSFAEHMDYIQRCGGSENMGICRGCRGHLPLRRKS